MLNRSTVRLLALSCLLLVVQASTLLAQCPMCKIAAESNLKHGGSAGNGLNFGILYMLAIPYLMVATMIFIWRRNRKKLKAAQLLDDHGDWKEL
ncbi:MAG: hypothetical protein ABIV51_03805 [Saprospiraceae bacterium]